MRNAIMRSAALVLLARAFMTLTACSQQTPQQACAAPATISQITDMIDQASAGGTTSDAFKSDLLSSALKTLWGNGVVKLDLVTLKGVDHDTKKIECDGQIEIKLNEAQQRAMIKAAGGGSPGSDVLAQMTLSGLGYDKAAGSFHDGQASLPIVFTRQPSADGTSFVFSYGRSDELESSLRVAAALQILSNQAPPLPAPAAAPDADASSSSDSAGEAAAPTQVENSTGASFDCAKASSNTEHMICSSPELADLDGRLASLFRKALAKSDSQAKALAVGEQRAWNRQVRDACTTPECLTEAFNVRIAKLRGDVGD